METTEPFEQALKEHLIALTSQAPPRLAHALDYALFPGGGRVRPKLCLEVFSALSGTDTALVNAGASAIEMMHCASLVHDDLPCFDDAPLRRGKASVHRVYGEDIALLVGDALIIGAMETLATGATDTPQQLPQLIGVLTRATGAGHGLVAGQAWELEPKSDMRTIHRAKTAALFEAAAVIGALSAGQTDDQPWRRIGRNIGSAYQIADDLLDKFGDPQVAGKPVHQDALNGRLNAGDTYSVIGAFLRLDTLIQEAVGLVPAGSGKKRLTDLLLYIGARLCPPRLRESIAAATKEIDVLQPEQPSLAV